MAIRAQDLLQTAQSHPVRISAIVDAEIRLIVDGVSA